MAYTILYLPPATIHTKNLLSTAYGCRPPWVDRRNHVTSGWGTPVALHVSRNVSPSRTTTSEFDDSLSITICGGTAYINHVTITLRVSTLQDNKAHRTLLNDTLNSTWLTAILVPQRIHILLAFRISLYIISLYIISSMNWDYIIYVWLEKLRLLYVWLGLTPPT